jgi:hypothetical protein
VSDLYPLGKPDKQGQTKDMGFRIQRFDDQGNPLDIVEVEVERKKVKGHFFVADSVSVKGKWKGDRIRADKIRNLTTNTEIT